MAVKDKALADRLEAYRVVKGMSQGDLSKLTGLPINSLSRYERGVVTPGVGSLVRIALALEVTASDLIGDNLAGFDIDAAALYREASE